MGYSITLRQFNEIGERFRQTRNNNAALVIKNILINYHARIIIVATFYCPYW